MKFRIFQTFLLFVIVSASAVACGGSYTAPNGMKAIDLLETSHNVSSTTNTSQVYMTMTFVANGTTLTANDSLYIDNLNHIKYHSTNTSLLVPLLYIGEVYTFNTSLYAHKWSESKWIKTQSPVYSWDKERTAYLFPVFAADAKYMGIETIEGIDYYKIEQDFNFPTFDNLMKIYGFNLSAYGSITQSDFKCTYLIDENTFYLIKASLAGNMVINNSFPVSISWNWIDLKINEPVNIVLPEAANNATAISYSDYASGNW
jgi:hypothetical protein